MQNTSGPISNWFAQAPSIRNPLPYELWLFKPYIFHRQAQNGQTLIKGIKSPCSALKWGLHIEQFVITLEISEAI